MKAPAMVSGDGSGPSVSAGTETIADADLEEERGERVLDLDGIEVQVVTADACQPNVEDEVGVGPCGEQLDQCRLAGDGRGIDLGLVEAGLADLELADGDGPGSGTVVELDEERLAGAVLVECDRLRGPGIGVRDAARLGRLGRMPVAEGQVVEAALGDLVGRDDDLVVLGLARDRDRAVDHPDPPAGPRLGGIHALRRRSTDTEERAVRRPLGGEDLARRLRGRGPSGGPTDGPGRGP